MKKGIIAASIICLMMSGCGKKNDVTNDLVDVTETVTAAETDSEDLAGEAEHKVVFSVASTVEDVEMSADLTIDTRIPAKVTTKKVKQVVVDDDYLLFLSKQIFDGGKYEVINVKDYSPEDAYSIMLGMMDGTEAKAGEFNRVFEPSAYYGYLSDMQEAGDAGQEDSEYSEGQVILRGSSKIEEGGETYVCYKERAFVQGDIDGEPYILEYTKQDYEPNSEMYQDVEDIMIYPMNGRQVYFNVDSSESDAHDDNKVNYSSALAMAETYVEQLGLADYAVATTFDLMADADSRGVRGFDGKMISGELSNSPSNIEKVGYRFIFTPAIDGLKLSYCAGTDRTTAEYDYDYVLSKDWLQPLVQIDVDETGVRGICVNRVYEFEDNLSNDSKIISFEKANELAKQMYSENYVEPYEVGDIRFEYIVIQYDDETVMVPAWVYYREGKSGLKFAVNALDGSVVHFSFNAESYVRRLK